MEAVARNVGREYPEIRDWGIRLVTFPRWLVADGVLDGRFEMARPGSLTPLNPT